MNTPLNTPLWSRGKRKRRLVPGRRYGKGEYKAGIVVRGEVILTRIQRLRIEGIVMEGGEPFYRLQIFYDGRDNALGRGTEGTFQGIEDWCDGAMSIKSGRIASEMLTEIAERIGDPWLLGEEAGPALVVNSSA